MIAPPQHDELIVKAKTSTLANPMSDEPIVAHDQSGLEPNDPENRQHPAV